MVLAFIEPIHECLGRFTTGGGEIYENENGPVGGAQRSLGDRVLDRVPGVMTISYPP